MDNNGSLTHTFSKIHGPRSLADRLELFGPAHSFDAVNRIRGPFKRFDAGDGLGSGVRRFEGNRARCQVSKCGAYEKWRKLVTERSGKKNFGGGALKVDAGGGGIYPDPFPPDKGRDPRRRRGV